MNVQPMIYLPLVPDKQWRALLQTEETYTKTTARYMGWLWTRPLYIAADLLPNRLGKIALFTLAGNIAYLRNDEKSIYTNRDILSYKKVVEHTKNIQKARFAFNLSQAFAMRHLSSADLLHKIQICDADLLQKELSTTRTTIAEATLCLELMLKEAMRFIKKDLPTLSSSSKKTSITEKAALIAQESKWIIQNKKQLLHLAAKGIAGEKELSSALAKIYLLRGTSYERLATLEAAQVIPSDELHQTTNGTQQAFLRAIRDYHFCSLLSSSPVAKKALQRVCTKISSFDKGEEAVNIILHPEKVQSLPLPHRSCEQTPLQHCIARENLLEAITTYKRLVKEDPSLQNNTTLAALYESVGFFQEAIEILQKISKEVPDKTAHWKKMARLESATGNHEQALLILHRLAKQHQSDPKELVMIADQLSLMNNHEKALRTYHLAEQLPNSPSTIREKIRLAKIRAAEHVLRKEKPNFTTASTLLSSLELSGDQEKFLHFYQQTLYTYSLTAKDKEQIQDFAKKPPTEKVTEYLEQHYQDDDQKMKKALSVTYFTRAVIAKEKGQLQEAIILAQKSVEKRLLPEKEYFNTLAQWFIEWGKTTNQTETAAKKALQCVISGASITL